MSPPCALSASRLSSAVLGWKIEGSFGEARSTPASCLQKEQPETHLLTGISLRNPTTGGLRFCIVGTLAVPASVLNFWELAHLRSVDAFAKAEQGWTFLFSTLLSYRLCLAPLMKSELICCLGRFHPFLQDSVQTSCHGLVSCEWAERERMCLEDSLTYT